MEPAADLRISASFKGAEVISELGADLRSLVRGVSAELVGVTPLTGNGYPGYRPKAFRLTFADGRVLKGRRVATAQQAEIVESVSHALADRGVPRVVARSGAAFLSDWIDGEPLRSGHVDAAVLRRCGVLHGWTHSHPLPAPSRQFDSGRYVRRRLDLILQLAELDQDLAHAAAGIAAVHAPADFAWGFGFGDFCAENIVLRPSGDVCLVDTESLAILPCDYDLARSWYRWPMQRAERESYVEGYRAHRQPTGFDTHFPYWAITATADGALYRSRIGGPAAATVPLQRLRALVDALDRGVTAEDAIFLS